MLGAAGTDEGAGLSLLIEFDLDASGFLFIKLITIGFLCGNGM